MTRMLRLLAFAIAIAGAVDPAITISGASRARVALVALDPADATATSIRERIARDLSTSYDVVPAITSDAAAAVVIGEHYPDELLVRSRFGAALPDALLVATVTTPGRTANGAHIVRVEAPREVPAATTIHVDAEIASRGMPGQTTDAIVTIAGLEVGRASHKWTAAAERWRASIDAVPVGDPPYVLRIEAGTQTDVVVGLRRNPIRVEFYDPRPSWAATFVRRALETDPRFQVATLSSTSRGIVTRTGEAVALEDPRLDTFDTVVVGGLDRLSAADVRALDRYMRERGGAVVVLPDQRIDSAPARDLIAHPDLAERLLEQPAKLVVALAAVPQASELLVFRVLPPAADVVARLPGPSRTSGPSRAGSTDGDSAPVIVSTPRGDGRLLLSGAMDAWRYRAADNGAFDRFWQSTIAGLALAVPPPIAIDVEPPVLRPGESGIVFARVRSREISGVGGSIDGQPLRLWPAAEPGVYRGEFVARSAAGQSTIEVRAELAAAAADPNHLRPGYGGPPKPSAKAEGPGLPNVQSLRSTRSLVVRSDAKPLRPAPAPSLALLAQSHHGIDVTADRVSELERFLRSAITSPRVPLVHHPMRSTWWIVPFAICLSAEWWLRRRRGLR